MGWTRNYYNILTALLLGDTTETSVNTPVDYQPPIVVRHATGDYKSWTGHYSSNYYPLEDPQDSHNREGVVQMLRIGQTSMGIYGAYTGTPPQYREASDASTTLQFGAGDTAESYEDYKLDDPIWTGYTVVSGTGTLTAPSAFDDVTHKYSSTRTFTFNNSSDSSITIKELGIFIGSVLLYREVLDSPITIDPAESVTVSFTREATVFNYTPYT